MLSKELFKEVQRLRWQCRRGLLELDYLLEAYLDQHYETASAAERSSYESLLDQHDLDLQYWLLQEQKPSNEALVDIVTKVRNIRA